MSNVPPPPQTSAFTADPTSIIGWRIVSWLIDLALVSFTSWIAVQILADREDGYSSDTCELVNSFSDYSCFPGFGDTTVLLSDGEVLMILALHVAVWLAFAVLEGITGASPGKFLTGVRVVKENGQKPGVGSSLVRSVLMVVDGFPWGLPMLTGLIVGSSGSRHQRVGDRVAATFVVKSKDAGRPIPAIVPVVTGVAAGGAQPWGAAPPPPPGAVGGWSAPPPVPGTGLPPAPSLPAPETPALVEAGTTWDAERGVYVNIAANGERQFWDDQLDIWRPID